jgi:predicted DNA-binding transcriptional regulator AlpA
MARRISNDIELAIIRARLLPDHLRDDRILNKKTAAALVGVSEKVLDRRIAAGKGPPFIRIGARKKGFVAKDVKSWLRSLAENYEPEAA